MPVVITVLPCGDAGRTKQIFPTLSMWGRRDDDNTADMTPIIKLLLDNDAYVN